MFTRSRKFLARALSGGKPTSVMVGSYINTEGERSVALRLVDGYEETAARLSPEGARAIARQLTEWSDWAEKGSVQLQWQTIVRTAISKDTKPEAAALAE